MKITEELISALIVCSPQEFPSLLSQIKDILFASENTPFLIPNIEALLPVIACLSYVKSYALYEALSVNLSMVDIQTTVKMLHAIYSTAIEYAVRESTHNLMFKLIYMAAEAPQHNPYFVDEDDPKPQIVPLEELRYWTTHQEEDPQTLLRYWLEHALGNSKDNKALLAADYVEENIRILNVPDRLMMAATVATKAQSYRVRQRGQDILNDVIANANNNGNLYITKCRQEVDRRWPGRKKPKGWQ